MISSAGIPFLKPKRRVSAVMRSENGLFSEGGFFSRRLKMEICTMARNFFARQTQFFAGILDVFQEKLGKCGGKRTVV